MNQNSPNPSDSFGLLLAIACANPEIAAFEFASLDFAPLLGARGPLSAADTVVADRALDLRESLHLPFWDGVMLAGSHSNIIPVGALAAAGFHQKLERKVKWVPAANLSISQLHRMSQTAHAEKRLLAVTSSVQMRNGIVKHIPLLDFHVGYSDYATCLVAEMIPLLGVSGALLKSGKSYHFYGDAFFDQHELTAFLGKALLFAPIVDRAWIAHQLIEGRCALRISPRAEYGGAPSFVRYV